MYSKVIVCICIIQLLGLFGNAYACSAGYFAEYVQRNNVWGSYCTECPAGKITSTSGQTACTACTLGKIADNTGMTACVDICFAGTYAQWASTFNIATIWGVYCYLCIPGKYTNVMGSSSCNRCDAGKYADTYKSTACKSCERGLYSNATAAIACTKCPNALQSSPLGSSSVSACTCDAGSTPIAGAAYSIGGFMSPYCSRCSPGTYKSELGTGYCAVCGIGKYAPTTGSSSCIICDSNSYAKEYGATTCTICERGLTSNLERTTCVECAEGTEYKDGMCRDCVAGSYSNSDTKLVCVPCRFGTYSATNKTANCDKCLACPDGYYRSNCSPLKGGGICIACDVCPEGYVNVGCMNRAGHTEERGTCRLRKYTARTPLCDQKKSGYGLGGYTFASLFGVSQDDSSFQCRRRCDNVQNVMSEDVYPLVRTALLSQFPDVLVDGKWTGRVFNGGYCGGPYACDVSNCNIAGSDDDTQDEYQPTNACPVYIDKDTAQKFWADTALVDSQTQSSVFAAVQAMRQTKCQTCAECGQDNIGLLPNWGRGCALDCTHLTCNSGLIFDWTEKVAADKCKTCGELDDIRLCLSSEQLPFDMYDVSGRLPKLYMRDCKPRNRMAPHGYEITYGSCVKCADFADSCISEGSKYYKTCEHDGAGIVPVCAACSVSNGREPTRSKYWDGQTLRNLYCQQKKCTVGVGLTFTGINRATTPHSLCHKQCTRKSCAASQALLPCVLPHAARCMDTINMDALVVDTLYTVRQYAPAHVNMLEPATDALHLFASFENTLVDTQAYQNDLRAQCVWNADYIMDNNMNPAGVSSTFQRACRPWLRNPRAAYPLMPLQNTVAPDDDDAGVFPRRVLLNTSAYAVAYGSDTVKRPADVFAGDIYLKLDLSNTNNATLAVFVPSDRNISATTWVPRWRVSVHAQQVEGDITSISLRTTNEDVCWSCFSLVTS